MQRKKRASLYVVLISMTLALIGGSIWWMHASDAKTKAEPETAMSANELPKQNTPAPDDPNVDANGHLVTSNDIKKTRQELLDAGLPANDWAPSDIKKIIVKSSRQGMDVITYARENFHGK